MAALAVAGVIAAGCGTGGTDVEFVEPTVTLFDETEVDDTVPEVATTRSGVDQLETAELPAPRSGAPGVVVIDGIAVAVDTSSVDGWTATSPCGALLTGASPAPRSAVVVLDPAGDARDAVSGVAPVAVNAAIAELTADRLNAAGVSALLTRDDDDLAASFRAAAANSAGARMIVSIAIVAADGDRSDTAALELVHPAGDPGGRRLAGLIHQSLAPALDELPVAWTEGVDPGVRAVLNQRGADYFTVLQGESGAARVVVHLPVLDDDTAAIVSGPVFAAAAADALADALARFLVTDDEGDGFVTPDEVVRNAPTASGTEECLDPLAVDVGSG